MSRSKGSQFIRFFIPIIEVLKESGGSGTVAEVIDRVIEKMNIPESEQEVTLKEWRITRSEPSSMGTPLSGIRRLH
jgi:hypothetical protein